MFGKHFLTAYYVPGTVADSRETTANSSKQRSSYSSWADSCTEGRRASQSCRKHTKMISGVPVSLPELPHSLTSAGARILYK